MLAFATASMTTGPRFLAVVQVYREGVMLIDGAGNQIRSAFDKIGRDGELTPGPGKTYVVTDLNNVIVYSGLKRQFKVPFANFTHVVGWLDGLPVAVSDKKAYRLTPHGKQLLPAWMATTEEIAGSLATGFVAALTHMEGGVEDTGHSDYWLSAGVTRKRLTGAGNDSGGLTNSRDGVLITPILEVGDGRQSKLVGALWQLDPATGKLTHLAGGHAGWMATEPDSKGRNWLTENGFDGHWEKFYDWGNAYKYSPSGGLQLVARVRGCFSAFGVDKTGRYLFGQEMYGYEMGAYDLVSIDLTTKRQTAILHGVEEFQQIQ